MDRSTLRVAGVVFFAVAGAVVSGPVAAIALGLVAAAAPSVGWCRHPRPLSLLPPMTLTGGVRQPAQWFCGKCGRSWPAEFEHDRPPVARFEGYDETKALQSARREKTLVRQRRELAVRRAGMSTTPKTPPAAARATRVSKPVVMQHARRVG